MKGGFPNHIKNFGIEGGINKSGIQWGFLKL